MDLFLIHSPSGGPKARKEMWQALEKLASEGKARSIGVSNFGTGHIEEMKSYARIWPPHVNQIEVCPGLFTLYVLFGWWLTDSSTSYTPGANNGPSSTSTTNTRSSSKPTTPSSAT